MTFSEANISGDHSPPVQALTISFCVVANKKDYFSTLRKF